MSGRGLTGSGRGGRGAALLKLVQEPVRKPGERPQEPVRKPGEPPQERPLQDQQQQPHKAVPHQQEFVGRGALYAVGRASGGSSQVKVGRGLPGLMQQDQRERQQLPPGAIPKKTSPPRSPVGLPPSSTSPSQRVAASPMGRGLARMSQKSPDMLAGGDRSKSTELPKSPAGRGLAGLGIGRNTVSPVQIPRPVSGAGDASQPQTEQRRDSPSPKAGEGAIEEPLKKLEELRIQEKPERVSKMGDTGTRTSVACNYLRMKCKFDAIYQYAVSFTPQVDSKSMRFQLVNAHREVIGQVKAFDGAILFLPVRLEEATTILRSNRPTDGCEIVIRIVLTKILRPEECVQPYNVIFKKIMRILDLKQVARHYYDPHKAVAVPQHKLEIWPGYITSLREYEGGLLLLCDVSHKVLRYQNVLDFMYNLYEKCPRDKFQDECTRQLVGNIVLTRYNNKTYRIDDIEWSKNPTCKFSYGRNGEEMTFVDYYKKSYNKVIQDLEQPLLISRPKRINKEGGQDEAICLIPELANLTGLTDEMRQDFRVMKDIASHTRVTPTQRVRAMRQFMENIKASPEATNELAKWGLELDTDILKCEARNVTNERIIFQNKTIPASNDADWGREVTREAVISPVHLQCWMVVFTKRDSNRAMDYIQMMKKVAPSMGIRVNHPLQLELRDDKTETYLRTIRESLNPQVQMVVVIFPTSRDDRYNAIKKLCCIESPVPSQVIISTTIGKQQKLRSVTQKIALQINCKLGGELWALEIPMQHVMVVGIDVYHDAAHKGKSVGAIVASTNKNLTRWFSRVCLQLPKQELMDGLKLCLTASLRKYHEVNHTLPDRIIVFRDGVGEGQLSFVSNYEVTQLKECFGHFGETYDPKLAVVVVQKRINTRIFAEYHGQFDNPRPGLVLDHTVTMNNWYDYFLVSQHVRQGTVSPTHYVVVYDSSNLKPDRMQRLSYKLTHLYYNWPGTVRVPAPCQYAHKLAYLVGQNIHKEPSHELSDRLFFL